MRLIRAVGYQPGLEPAVVQPSQGFGGIRAGVENEFLDEPQPVGRGASELSRRRSGGQVGGRGGELGLQRRELADQPRLAARSPSPLEDFAGEAKQLGYFCLNT